MYIDVVRPETWDELNDSLKTQIGLADPLRVRVFKGLAHAVFEIAQGSAQFMAHKKSIGFIKGQTPVFENLLPYYYKETYEVNIMSHLQLEDVKAWADGLKKDTNFVVFAEDHPVTGELYPFVDELDKVLNEKRIYAFRISHSRHFHHKTDMRPYSVRLCSYSGNLAVAVLGERFRCPPMMVQNMEWNQGDVSQELMLSQEGRKLNESLVSSFEASLADIAQPYFSSGKARLFDRAVLVFKDVSAEALLEKTFAKLSLSSAEGWGMADSTNMCHWSDMKMFSNWWEPAPSLESLRGLVIASPTILENPQFASALRESYQELLEEQSWNV
ncbi:hypothetical protein B9G69_017645 [Bdellovibrio sp. SKB1291214]|uniref:hypothetical protein n=1 Tax=Bdellovibrio sp. SKB1291214 TaxID=1732569 RepID=UPI000B518BB9|nr:hypothetical protein [Bdellovibrio sp. SKB1291214]UYL08868.1 hypothetical protein B9G69_017645 [Bdellovibrio sp. SKB1291214]